MKTRVLIVDDSALARDMIAAALARAEDIEVVGMAADPLLARRQIALLHPDVLTLDVEMPNMDGLAFLDQVMRLRPMPVVMVSSVTSGDSLAAAHAEALGAVAVVEKPAMGNTSFESVADTLIAHVRNAGKAKVSALPEGTGPHGVLAESLRVGLTKASAPVVVVGGAGAMPPLVSLARQWPAQAPALVAMVTACQHQVQTVATVLTELASRAVKSAHEGMVLERGQVVVCTAATPMMVCQRDPLGYGLATISPFPGPLPETAQGSEWGSLSQNQRPGDVLMTSLSACVGAGAVGCLLSGEGDDGAPGLRTVITHGGVGLVQDSASSMCSGLAQAVLRWNIPARAVPLGRLVPEILNAVAYQNHNADEDVVRPTTQAFGVET